MMTTALSQGVCCREEKELEDMVGTVMVMGDVEQKLEVAAGISRCVTMTSSSFSSLTDSACSKHLKGF